MIPRKFKIELIVETDRADKNCTEADIKNWYLTQLEKSLNAYIELTGKTNRVTDCNVTILEGD